MNRVIAFTSKNDLTNVTKRYIEKFNAHMGVVAVSFVGVAIATATSCPFRLSDSHHNLISSNKDAEFFTLIIMPMVIILMHFYQTTSNLQLQYQQWHS